MSALPIRLDLYDLVVPLMPEGWLDSLVTTDVRVGWSAEAEWLARVVPALSGIVSTLQGVRYEPEPGGPEAAWLHICLDEGASLGWHKDRPEKDSITSCLTLSESLSAGCGGDLVVKRPNGGGEAQYTTAQGDCVFFPSCWQHRSTPLRVAALRVKATMVFRPVS